MATAYRYTGETPRDYPTLGCSVKPGDVIYLDGRAPDARFVEVTEVTEQPAPDEQPEPTPEPEQPKRKPGRPRKTDTIDDKAGE